MPPPITTTSYLALMVATFAVATRCPSRCQHALHQPCLSPARDAQAERRGGEWEVPSGLSLYEAPPPPSPPPITTPWEAGDRPCPDKPRDGSAATCQPAKQVQGKDRLARAALSIAESCDGSFLRLRYFKALPAPSNGFLPSLFRTEKLCPREEGTRSADA